MRFAFFLALVLSTSALHAAKLTGIYAVTGKNPDGTAYAGTLTISQKGSGWKLLWKTGSESTGTGVQMGDILAVAIGGAQCAPVAYRVLPEGGLDGVWTLPGGDVIAREHATPGDGTMQGLAGDYLVSGANQLDNSVYKGALSVFKEGDHWRFSWRLKNSYEGYGIERDGRIGVSFGAPTCGVVLYQIGADGSLQGEWLYRKGGVGSEQALRR